MSDLSATTPVRPLSVPSYVALLVVLVSGGPAMAMMFTAVGPVLPSLMHQFSAWGDGALIAQLVMTIPSIGIIVAGAPNGWLVERFGGAAVLRWSLFIYGAAGGAGWILESLPAFLATRLVVGFAASGIATAALALAGEYFTDDQRARVLSYQTAAGAATGFVSLLCAGAAAQAFGWHAPFALYLSSWLVLALAMFALPATDGRRARAVGVGKSEGNDADRGELLKLWPMYVLIVAVFIAVFMGAIQVSFLLAADGVVSPAVQSWVLACGSIGNALGALAYGWLRPRLGNRWIFVLSLLFLGAGNLLLGGSSGVVVKMAGIAISAAGAGAVGPYLVGLLLDKAAPQVRGRAAGLMFSATYIGDFLNPLAVTPLRLAFGIHGAFLCIGGLCAVAALFVAVRRARRGAR